MKITIRKNRQLWVNFSVGFIVSFSVILAISAIQDSKIGFDTVIRSIIIALFITIVNLLASKRITLLRRSSNEYDI